MTKEMNIMTFFHTGMVGHANDNTMMRIEILTSFWRRNWQKMEIYNTNKKNETNGSNQNITINDR